MQKIDLRTVTMDIPAQEVITRDNVTVRVNAVAYFRVIDPSAAVVNVADHIRATSQIAQTTLRELISARARWTICSASARRSIGNCSRLSMSRPSEVSRQGQCG
ncbi:MAG: SPFH domain-containing protein [Thermomicrobiales bacterium]|nr:SPFH domain-containing protein [Thermomicrobiales bacterium]